MRCGLDKKGLRNQSYSGNVNSKKVVFKTNAPSWIRALSDLDLAWILLMPDLNLTMSGLSLSEILPVSELRPA